MEPSQRPGSGRSQMPAQNHPRLVCRNRQPDGGLPAGHLHHLPGPNHGPPPGPKVPDPARVHVRYLPPRHRRVAPLLRPRPRARHAQAHEDRGRDHAPPARRGRDGVLRPLHGGGGLGRAGAERVRPRAPGLAAGVGDVAGAAAGPDGDVRGVQLPGTDRVLQQGVPRAHEEHRQRALLGVVRGGELSEQRADLGGEEGDRPPDGLAGE
ncbi:unnamed protein product [Linum tenue]|uniref:Uncharacterized protein n=1 Tax=Linum tenue TaxID=586396 RepID=A0AAV0HPD0_9ROSI|nr:unnamed protein product [Linum tenue]